MTIDPSPADVVLEVLYLDAQTCDPCRATTDAVDTAAATIADHLRRRGRTLTVRRIHVTDQEQADALGFVSSPTVRVNGTDIELDAQEQHCGSCSALAGQHVDCRTFHWQGGTHPSPPADMITARVLDHLDGTLPIASPTDGPGPSSVERFLTARRGRPAGPAAVRP